MNRLTVLCLPALLLSAVPGAAEIYRWTDERGKTHFGENPPEGRPAQALHGGAVSFMGGGAAPAKAEKPRLFVTQSCPYCNKAKAFLRKRGTPFEELDIEASASARAEYDRLGGRGVPVILLGQKRMDGYDQARLAAWLDEAGL